jgi:hypothetical protein
LKGLWKINDECGKKMTEVGKLFISNYLGGEWYENYHYRTNFSFEL